MAIKLFPIVLSLLLSLKVLGCDCVTLSNTKTKDYLSMVDYVFTGKVIELIKAEWEEIEIPEFLDTIPSGREQWLSIYNANLYFAKVLVLNPIQGVVASDTLFFTSEFTNCDPIYELNQSYLFFADQKTEGQYMMTQCTPWGKLEDSQKTILELTK